MASLADVAKLANVSIPTASRVLNGSKHPVALNHPDAALLLLLVDERPEEVSELVDWRRGEVVASSFDLPHARHVAVAEMVFEHARRQVEIGRDVVIVLDSLTRLARSHNTAGRSSGRTMSGGLDANALAKPKALFGSAPRTFAPNRDSVRHGIINDPGHTAPRSIGIEMDRWIHRPPIGAVWIDRDVCHFPRDQILRGLHRQLRQYRVHDVPACPRGYHAKHSSMDALPS